MSVWTAAIVGYSLRGPSLWRLPESLNRNERLATGIHELELAAQRPNLHQRNKAPWAWADRVTEQGVFEYGNNWPQGEYLALEGPLITLYFAARTCQILSPWVHWHTFLEEKAVQLCFRRVTAELAQILASDIDRPAGVFVPNSGYPESQALDINQETLADVVRWLESRFGPPSPTIASMYFEDPDGAPNSHGYYLERFEGI